MLQKKGGGTDMLKDIVTTSMVSGVLNEVTGLLPILLPTAITFIAIRKGISFLLGTLKGA